MVSSAIILISIWFVLKNYTYIYSVFALQARATIIHILELQIKRRKQAVEDIKRYGLSNHQTSIWPVVTVIFFL